MDIFTSMQVFQKVAESLSFKAAADYFNISPTAVSKQIASLEERLGSTLLTRTTRRVQLTETGREYLLRCRRILDDLAETESMIRESSGTPRGLLRVGSPLGFGLMHLAPTLSKFLSKYPKVKIELKFNDRIEDPMETGHDVTLRITKELKDSSLVAVKLGEVQLVIVASPDYLKRYGTPKRPEDLSRHNFLLYSNATKPGHVRLMNKENEIFIPVKGQLITNSTLAIIPQLLTGQGLAQLPRFYVQEQIAKGKLKVLMPRYKSPTYFLWAILPPTGANSLRSRTFLDFLKEEFSKRIW